LALLVGGCAPAPAWRGLVKVGLVQPFHGPDAPAAMATHVAVRQRLIDANAAGGAGGYRLELVSLDDEGDPGVAARRAAELAADPLVVAVLAPSGRGLEAQLAGARLRMEPVDGPAAAERAVDALLARIRAAGASGRPTRLALLFRP
jgi:hypothetical protein